MRGTADRPALPAARDDVPAARMAVLRGRVAAIRLLEDAPHRRAAFRTQTEEAEDRRPVAGVADEWERAASVAHVVLRRIRPTFSLDTGARTGAVSKPSHTLCLITGHH